MKNQTRKRVGIVSSGFQNNITIRIYPINPLRICGIFDTMRKKAIAKRETQLYFYAPNYPREKLVWITSGYSYDHNIVDNIHNYISPYGYKNPFTGEAGDSFWVEVTITNK